MKAILEINGRCHRGNIEYTFLVMHFSQVNESIRQTPKAILTGMGRMSRINTQI